MPTDADVPDSHAAKAPEHRVPRPLDSVLEWGQRFGISFHIPERLVAWWKLIGFRKACAVMFVIALPLLKYEWLPAIASGTLTGMASAYGVNLKVGEWTGDLYDLKATAHDVVIETHGQYAESALLHADALVLDLGLWRRIRTGNWIQQVEIEGPRLYLEHTLSGRWNFEDVLDIELLTGGAPSGNSPAPDLYRVRDTAAVTPAPSHQFEIPNLTIKGMRVQWVENLPGQSGGGLIHSSRAILYMDDVSVVVDELAGPVEIREAPTRFSIDGRTADGRISINGRANLFRWAEGRSSRMGLAEVGAPPVIWSPKAAMKIYLENVGTSALAQMVPTPSLINTAGTMTGTIQLAVQERRVDCRSDLELKNVAFAANPYSSQLKGRVNAVQKELIDFRANGRMTVGCEGDLDNAAYRPLYVLQTRLTQEAVKTASPAVREAAASDYQRLGGQVLEAGMQDVSNELARKAGEAMSRYVGPETGAVISQSLAGGAQSGTRQSSAKPANPVTKGAKGVGAAFKKLFGGGKKKPTSNPPS